MIDTSLFPYETFPVRLEFGEKKNLTVCHFQCDEHLQKYLERYKLDKRTIKVTYRDGEPTKSSTSKRNQNNLQKRSGKIDSGSSTKSTRKTKKLDTSRGSNRTRKTN